MLGCLFQFYFITGEVGKEGQLIKAMMSNYDVMIRPTNFTNPVVVVALGLAMTEIAELVNISVGM